MKQVAVRPIVHSDAYIVTSSMAESVAYGDRLAQDELDNLNESADVTIGPDVTLNDQHDLG